MTIWYFGRGLLFCATLYGCARVFQSVFIPTTWPRTEVHRKPVLRALDLVRTSALPSDREWSKTAPFQSPVPCRVPHQRSTPTKCRPATVTATWKACCPARSRHRRRRKTGAARNRRSTTRRTWRPRVEVYCQLVKSSGHAGTAD